MSTLRHILLLLIVFTISGGSQPALTAQRIESTFTSETTGAVIDIGTSGEATFDPEFSGIWDMGDYIQEDVSISTDFADLRIAFLDSPDSLETVMHNTHLFNAPYGHKYEVLQQQVGPETATLLEFTTYKLQFIEAGYIEMQQPVAGGATMVVSIYTTEEILVERLNWFAANVTVDGESPFLEQSYDHLQPILDGTSGTQPQVMTEYSATLADWEELGLVSESEWHSPIYGSVVTWDSTWQVPLNRSGIIESGEGNLDSILLITPAMDGDIVVNVGSTVEDRATPQSWINHWTSEGFTADLTGGTPYTFLAVTTSEGSAAVMYEKTSPWGHTYVVVYEAYLVSDGSIILTRTTATREDFAKIYEDARTSVEVDGAIYPLAWTAEEIEAIFAD